MTGPGSKPRVLMVLGPSTGGIRGHVAALTTALSSRGWRIRVAGPPGVMAGLGPQDAEVAVSSRPGSVVSAVRTLRRLAADADLIHAHGLTAGWIAVLARTRTPVVVTAHNTVLDEVAGRRAGVLRALEARLPDRVAATIAVSQQIAENLGGEGTRSIRVVPPLSRPPRPGRPTGAVRRRLGVPEGGSLVVSAARLHPQKDLPTLFAAVERLRPERPDLRLVVIGEGRSRPDLEARLARSGLDEMVSLPGASDNAADELAAADVVALSSRWEGAPLAATEALTLERPLVATAVGHLPTVVGAEGGHLVPVGDPAAMASAIAAVLDDPVAAAAMARAGHRRVETHLGADVLTDAIVEVYEAAIAPSDEAEWSA